MDILICGVGGQGTVLASRLLAWIAMEKGLTARTAETIGMAQRGGSVVSHVRTGHVIFSPMIPIGGADVILALEPAEAVRCYPYLKQGGAMLINTTPIQPITASLAGKPYDAQAMIDSLTATHADVHLLDGPAVCAACGSPKALNTAMLATAVKLGLLDVTLEELRAAIISRTREKFHALNLRAIDYVTEEATL
ncbi:MAG TPA: indolepyruvate oxidoreductase subunit beta [Candidatus Limiplasma sp.]|nr:indolepyruvate oxidoreductase subunit beta [Candidatus Limiplasma sp.]